MYRTSPPAGAPPQESCYGHMILKILDVNLNVLDYIQSIWCCFHIWFLGNITLKLGISKRHVMDSIKPITLYGHATGPNPWKVAIIFEELDIQYEMRIIPLNELKQPAYERICINGRTPAIEDPNTGITLWESGAIIEYLVETYDKGRKLGFEVGTPGTRILACKAMAVFPSFGPRSILWSGRVVQDVPCGEGTKRSGSLCQRNPPRVGGAQSSSART